MKLWTYGEVRKKLERDFDLQDETFISTDELAGYCNEGIEAAEAEILKLNEDYFLKYALMDLTVSQATLTLPTDIYAQKIRSLIYNNGGSLVYPVKRIRDPNKFAIVANTEVFATSDWYAYIIQNQTVGTQNTLRLVPPSRETATGILTLWYIRHAQRIPLLGEYSIASTFLPAAINTGTSVITITGHGYVTGDKVKFAGSTGATNPSGIIFGTIYYVVVQDANSFKLATTLSSARANVTVPIMSQGIGTFTSTVATTEVNRDTVILDIPEYTSFVMQFMKVRCYEKEPDPRYDGAVQVLAALQKQMVESLTEQVPDNDNMLPLDLSIYQDMS